MMVMMDMKYDGYGCVGNAINNLYFLFENEKWRKDRIFSTILYLSSRRPANLKRCVICYMMLLRFE